MTCREFEKNLNEWQGEPGPLARALAPHAGECPACRQRLELQAELMSSLKRLARSTESLQPPESIEGHLREAVRRRGSASLQQTETWSWPRWGAVAAGVVLFIVAGIQVGLLLNQPDQLADSTPAQPVSAAPDEENPTVAVGSEFIRIGGCLDPECLRNSQLMRVRIPRSSLLQFGLPMNTELAENEVLADVLVAEDGSAQAIRFVNY